MALLMIRSVSCALTQNFSRKCWLRSCGYSKTAAIIQIQTQDPQSYIEASDDETFKILANDMLVYDNFLTKEEEKSLITEIEPVVKRMRYEYEHWDDAIHGYRETERKKWNNENQLILKRVRECSFPVGTPQIDFTHILDLKKDGYIKPHVDAVRFCGRIIAGLCLLSPCVMRLVMVDDKTRYGDILLNQRALYVMKDRARYEFSHEVLEESKSIFKGNVVPRDRRISVMCRNEPDKDNRET
ncbi:alpha-ketoglutarate-dependent dioxygenase alkB homolog 7, mitochondrial [Patella vulgata]|uniref:alpha-ketoglutarate-dependent dioxygenase alkB homolog 7, mitochondrial n=1 Tax=Patella vulgata TaxID=6465 RepID=UPI00217FC9FD|nr:alpha-ketoglutarate-dependent dioxygenase alkB homolog 7, mitochondrial [Patella vulgata]XP_055956433.1 alpha-ketoglutarate-dependent dioxygenase alkB homolog 7, mitochondrial [Patella vulgata]